MEVVTKIVHYNFFCKNCEHFEKEGWDDPCHECLSTPARENTHTPLHFEPKGSAKNSNKTRRKNTSYNRKKC